MGGRASRWTTGRRRGDATRRDGRSNDGGKCRVLERVEATAGAPAGCSLGSAVCRETEVVLRGKLWLDGHFNAVANRP